MIKVKVEARGRTYVVTFRSHKDGSFEGVIEAPSSILKFKWRSGEYETPALYPAPKKLKEAKLWASKLLMAASKAVISDSVKGATDKDESPDPYVSRGITTPHVRIPYTRKSQGQKFLIRAVVVNAAFASEAVLLPLQMKVDFLNALASIHGDPISYKEALRVKFGEA